MPEEKKADEVERILHDEKALEDRKQAAIADLLKQREAAIASFDEKLAKLGHHVTSDKRRSHHRKHASAAAASTKAVEKPKA
jgi:hypothetical protein